MKISNADATYNQVSYDDITNTVVIHDENQHKKEYHMNWTQDIQWVKEYTGAVTYYLTQYTYDSIGNLTSITNANGNTTRYDYDSLFNNPSPRITSLSGSLSPEVLTIPGET